MSAITPKEFFQAVAHGTTEEKTNAYISYYRMNKKDRETIFIESMHLFAKLGSDLSIKQSKERGHYIAKYEKWLASSKRAEVGENVGKVGAGITAGSLGGIALPILLAGIPIGLATTATGAIIHIVNLKPLSVEILAGKYYKESPWMNEEEIWKKANSDFDNHAKEIEKYHERSYELKD